MQTNILSGGFADAAIQSAHAFRSVMEAMARPGTIQNLEGASPPSPLSPAAGAVLLTLCDTETPLYLAGCMDCDDVRAWVSFHVGAPFVGPEHSMFAIGTPEHPNRSATLIVDSAPLSQTGAKLTGPGIKDQARLSLPELNAFQANRALFPLGLDFIFTCTRHVAALPRTTEVS